MNGSHGAATAIPGNGERAVGRFVQRFAEDIESPRRRLAGGAKGAFVELGAVRG